MSVDAGFCLWDKYDEKTMYETALLLYGQWGDAALWDYDEIEEEDQTLENMKDYEREEFEENFLNPLKKGYSVWGYWDGYRPWAWALVLIRYFHANAPELKYRICVNGDPDIDGPVSFLCSYDGEKYLLGETVGTKRIKYGAVVVPKEDFLKIKNYNKEREWLFDKVRFLEREPLEENRIEFWDFSMETGWKEEIDLAEYEK